MKWQSAKAFDTAEASPSTQLLHIAVPWIDAVGFVLKTQVNSALDEGGYLPVGNSAH